MTSTPASADAPHPPASPPPLRVVVIGGGIGGLALTAGLRRAGFAVEVHDRDTDPALTGGYHLTLDGPAQAALRTLLAPEAWTRLLASASAVRRRPPDVWFDWHGRLLGRLEVKGFDADSIDVDRITLRVLLAEAAGSSLVLSSTCTGVERGLGPVVRARFADGSTVEADLLVGADGPHSLVARHLTGQDPSRPAGLLGVSGRTSAADLEPGESERLGPRSSLSVGPGGTAVYAGYLDPDGYAVVDAPELRAAVTTGPTYIWGAMFPEAPSVAHLRGLRHGALRDATVSALATAGWHERSLEVIARTDPDTVAAYRFNVGPEQVQDMAPWPAGRVTALGDAVHATPPTAGKGAGTAIIDAQRLVEELVAVREGHQTLHAAVGGFEADMRHRGSEVIALSMLTVDRILAGTTPTGSLLTRVGLPLLAWSTVLRRSWGRRP